MSIRLLKEKDEKFALKLKPVKRKYSTKCWEWQGALFANGYGRLGTPKKIENNSIHRAHIYAYVLAYGNKKDDTLILHKCDNKTCCRPDHLYEGDHAQNMTDMALRTAARAEKHGKTSLTSEDASYAKWLRDCHFSLDQISSIFSIGRNTAQRIISDVGAWKDVEAASPKKEQFVDYLRRRRLSGKSLTLPSDVSRNNWRGDRDYQMLLSFLNVYTQQEVANTFEVSRNSIRNAAKQAMLLPEVTLNEAKRIREDYIKWRKKYSSILKLIERYSK